MTESKDLVAPRTAPLAAPGESKELHVVFKVADAEFALPFDVVLQMESFAGATAVPGAPPFVA